MKNEKLTVGLLGGTGPEGRGLAIRWAQAGATVILGSRDRERASAIAAQLNDVIGVARIRGAENREAVAQSGLCLLTVPFQNADSILQTHQNDFPEGSLLIDTTVPVSFENGRARYVEPPEGSGAEHLRQIINDLHIKVDFAACFKTIPAHLLAEFSEPLDCDDFVVGESRQARERAIEAIRLIQRLRPIDAGPLENARVLERMTVLAIGINRRYKIKAGRYRFIGL